LDHEEAAAGTMDVIEGHCQCGFVHYRAVGPHSSATSCHCSICRRCSGAPFVAWLTVPRATFRFLTGEPEIFRSSDHAQRTFCPRCGTPLTFSSDRAPDEVDVTIGSLVQPDGVKPTDHTWVSSKLAWIELDDGLPSFPAARPS
jgi:hypothetical protein